MTETIHLIVEQGDDKGKQITVPPEGARLGRSSRNDIVLIDPEISRHHCRLFFKTGDGLWITDLGSINQTFVNNKPVQENPVRVDDLITVGDTILKVLNDGITESAPAHPQKPAGPSVFDLGLSSEKKEPAGKKHGKKSLIMIACLATALALAIWLPKIFQNKLSNWSLQPRPTASIAPELEQTLEIDYEKVQANSENIFRYKLKIAKDNTISVQIDDIQNNRHLRKEKHMENEYIQNLARSILDMGFFTLSQEYQGIQPDILDSWDLSITIGNRTHRTKVVNRVEPEIFKNVRAMIEECGKNELGLWAIQFSASKLIEMAREADLLGKKLYDEREIKYGNIAAAIQKFEEADGYLETVEPKPDFYAEILSSLTDCKRELQEKYNDQNFRAERAIRLREWEEAARELRTLCEMIPDRSDPRNQEARRKLLDIENRLNTKR